MHGKMYKSRMCMWMLAAVNQHLFRLPRISSVLPRSLFLGCKRRDKLRYVYCDCIGVFIFIYFIHY